MISCVVLLVGLGLPGLAIVWIKTHPVEAMEWCWHAHRFSQRLTALGELPEEAVPNAPRTVWQMLRFMRELWEETR